MKKNLRSIPIGVLAGSLIAAYYLLEQEITYQVLVGAAIDFIGAIIIFTGIAEGIISYAEKQKTVKGIIKESLVIVLVVSIFVFLIKTR